MLGHDSTSSISLTSIKWDFESERTRRDVSYQTALRDIPGMGGCTGVYLSGVLELPYHGIMKLCISTVLSAN